MKIKDFMKQIYNGLLPFITALFYSFSANADCAGSGLSIFPSGSTIKQNSIFVLEGYAQSQKVILGLNKAYPVYLKSGNQKINLIITEINKSLVYYGCGPSIHVVFSNPAKDNSDIIVQTTVKDLKTKQETTYYIQPVGDKIKVGHGMCSGAFDFEDGSQNFEVAFAFIDASGNLTPWTGEPIKFTKPKVQTSDEEE